MKAIITKVKMCDKSLKPRYKVGIQTDDGATIKGFFIRGPWCKSTAQEKRNQLQRDIDADLIHLPRRYRLPLEELSNNEKRKLQHEAS